MRAKCMECGQELPMYTNTNEEFIVHSHKDQTDDATLNILNIGSGGGLVNGS